MYILLYCTVLYCICTYVDGRREWASNCVEKVDLEDIQVINAFKIDLDDGVGLQSHPNNVSNFVTASIDWELILGQFSLFDRIRFLPVDIQPPQFWPSIILVPANEALLGISNGINCKSCREAGPAIGISDGNFLQNGLYVE